MFSQLPDFAAWFPKENGFSRPDWPAIRTWIKGNVPPEKWEDAWQGITREWLDRLRLELGGSYCVTESAHFHLLTEQEERDRESLLKFLEVVRTQMLRQLGQIPLPKGHGKHVALRFTELNDYYRYIAYFDAEGDYAGSGGSFIRAGYRHIAYPHEERRNADRAALVHEYTHNLLVNLPLPAWLNEALAMTFERDLAGSPGRALTRDLVAEHQSYWNTQTIQEFWRGGSFRAVEGQKLSYSLARILFDFIVTDLKATPAELREFVLHANRKDAGEAAAQDHLGVNLEDLVAAFLGPGEWRPVTSSA